ncbi:MAG: ECF transporter S component [Clostridiales bacterium]|nr:ECF transporter S component [Clostridiales bacterium]
MNTQQTKKMVFSAFFVALALLLPFLTGQIQQIGSMLSPMHIPVLLCGFICGWPWGLLVGAVSPILRSFIFGMPRLMPVAVAMAFELAVYGAAAGILYTMLPKKPINTYINLILAMLAGRIVWGVVMYFLIMSGGGSYSVQAFMAGAFIKAWPGIILHIAIIPPIIMALEKARLIPLN